MVKRNHNIAKLHSSYLFREINKRRNELMEKNPDVRIISLGIGDTTQPITPHINSGLEKAVKALGLDFGAVDCCIDVKKKAWVIECNTGPGLEGSSLEAWVKALKDLLSGKTKKVAATADKVTTATGNAALREKLKGQAEFMSAMVEAADDAELEAMGSLFNKMGVSK